MKTNSIETLWKEYIAKNNIKNSEPTEEFKQLFNFFSGIIRDQESKLAKAEKSLDTYKIHNHSHLTKNHALAQEIKKLKEKVSAKAGN